MNSSSTIQHNECVKLLIVEDEEKIAHYLKKGLRQEGYIVDYFITAHEAEEYIHENQDSLDLIILDSLLPGKSGVEFCKELRRQNISLPILMLTAKDESEDIIQGLDAGVDDYITKPFSFGVLLARIRALLRRRGKAQQISHELEIGDLVLNISTRKVFYGEKEMLLTLKEFNLLEFLLSHPNEVFDREQLLEKIWDINYNSFSNVVDVHVKNLRKKLKEVGGIEILETVRGVGYRLKT